MPEQTLFLEIAKKILRQLITGRLADADSFLFKLHEMPDKGSDQENCNFIKEEIVGAIMVRSEQNYLPLTLLIQTIYDKLEASELLNIVYNDEPLNQFRYHMAYYFSKQAVDAPTQPSPLLTNSHMESQKKEALIQKEALILQALENCAHELEVLDKDHEDYPENQRSLVIRQITRLEQQIIAGLERYPLPSLPISLGSISIDSMLFLRPKAGLLENCLSKAKKEISFKKGNTLAIETETVSPPPCNL